MGRLDVLFISDDPTIEFGLFRFKLLFLLRVLETLPFLESDAFLEDDRAGGIGGLSVWSFFLSGVFANPMRRLGRLLLLESELLLEPDPVLVVLGRVFSSVFLMEPALWRVDEGGVFSSFFFIEPALLRVDEEGGTFSLLGVIISLLDGGFLGGFRLFKLARFKKFESELVSEFRFL